MRSGIAVIHTNDLDGFSFVRSSEEVRAELAEFGEPFAAALDLLGRCSLAQLYELESRLGTLRSLARMRESLPAVGSATRQGG